MTVRVGINGFGRIGRTCPRAALEQSYGNESTCTDRLLDLTAPVADDR